jgi:hypothetical protein
MKSKYLYKEIKIGWLRFSIYWLNTKFTIRLELSKGWED